ncbi:MAG: hypothetical protein N2246_03485 [Candidatus Sumerlaeia bacterium]|nr:hypothetical protein [Candidatus Sumerlaeia bacterium]
MFQLEELETSRAGKVRMEFAQFAINNRCITYL